MKTIASLESSQANLADVYLFWLAILSNLKCVLDSGDTGFITREAGQICAVANDRFCELLTEGPNDCFILAFYLDPRMSLYLFTIVYVLSQRFCQAMFTPRSSRSLILLNSQSQCLPNIPRKRNYQEARSPVKLLISKFCNMLGSS